MLVITGVAIVTVEDLHFATSFLGISLAAASVVCSSLQQVLVRGLQKKYHLSPRELLSITAPSQAAMLLALGPFIDDALTNQWFFNFEWTQAAVIAVIVSCTLAIAVNLSQFMCLGKLSAVSFQVLGHAKTVLVLLGGWVLLGEHVNMKKLVGVCFAVGGMVAYSRVQMVSNSNKRGVAGDQHHLHADDENTKLLHADHKVEQEPDGVVLAPGAAMGGKPRKAATEKFY